jgi:signal transduction histidine kinase
VIQLEDLNLSDRLKIEASKRINAGVLFQLTILITLLFYYGSQPDQSGFFAYALIANSALIASRGILYQLNKKDLKSLLKIFNTQMFTGMLTGLLFGLTVADAILHFQTLNREVIVLIFLAAGIMTAVLSSLSPVPVFQRTYFILISIPIILALLNPNLDPVFKDSGLLFSIFVLYLLYGSRGITKNLKAAYMNEITAREQKKTLQNVINLVPGFVALCDSNENWVTSSTSFEKFRENSMLHHTLKQFRQSELGQFTREITWSDIENGQAVEHAYVISVQKYEDQSMIVVGVPAEELMQMRKELDSQRVKIEFSARLATLGEMAGGIAHEVNNPLAVIVGNCAQVVRMLKDTEVDRPKISEKMDKITKTSFRIGKIITGLRSFSRQSDQDPFIYTKVSQMLDDTFELCKEKFHQNGIKINIETVPEIEIPIRPIQVSQVLINLMNNSYDAVQKIEREKRLINITFEKTELDLVISISDSGPGVSEQIATRIFDPFYTTKEVGQGTGLGLSIARSILLDHQGDIQLVKNAKMTTFQIHLPLHRTEKVAKENTDSTKQNVSA